MPVHCGPQSEQDSLSMHKGDGSPTPSMMDQIRVIMQNNMSQMLQKVQQEEEGWKKKIASLEAQVNSLLQEKGMLEAKVEGLFDAVYTAQQNIKSLQQKKGTLVAEVQRMDDTLYERQQNINRLQQENDRLAAKVQDLKDTLYDRQEDINSLRQEKCTLDAKVQSMEYTLNDKQKNIDSLQHEKGTLDAKMKSMEHTLHERQEDIKSLLQENGMLEADVQSMEYRLYARLYERQQNINSLQQEKDKLDAKVESMENTLCDRQEDINSLQQKKGTLEAKVQELEDTKWRHSKRIYELILSKEALQHTLYSSPYEIGCRFQPNGRALIINNTLFTTSEMSERTSAEGDPEKLAEAFQSLQPVNIEVKTYQNLDLPTMLNVLEEEANRDHTNEDFFICCIMTHGTQGKVYAANGYGVDILDIVSSFNGKRCPSLMGKPKLFFIQACQGDKDQAFERASDNSDASPSSILAYLSTEADFLLALATVPGYVAYRGEDGAHFVNVLAKVLKEHGKSQDLMSMMATVSREVNERYKYSTFCCTTLRHKLFFKHYSGNLR